MNARKVSLMLLTITAAAVLAACGEQAEYEEPMSNPEVTHPDESAAVSTENAPTLDYDIGVAVPMPSETAKNEELEKLIIDEWSIPEETQADTRYYYNYVDLNADGTDEVLALVVGDYTSGSGGSSMLIASQKDGKLTAMQSLSGIQAPVISSDTLENDWMDIIVASGDAWMILSYDGKEYPAVSDGTELASVENVSGYAVFYNDLAADVDGGSALHLG